MATMRPLQIVVLLLSLGVSMTAAAQSATPTAAPSAPARSTTLRIALVGQALINADLRQLAPLAVAQAKDYLNGADVRFTNLETALAPRDMAVELRTPTVHRSGPEVLDALRDMGFNMLSMANNHAWDLGAAGLLAGRDEATRRGFTHAGTGPDAATAAAAAYMETPAGTVALVAMASGAVQLVNPNTWAGPGRPGVNYLDVRQDEIGRASCRERV